MPAKLLLAAIFLCAPAIAVPAQSPPPFRIGLNFPFAGPTNATFANIFTNITPLGLRGMRHTAPGDVTWSSLQPTNTLPLNFANADQAFFNTNGIMPLGTFYDVSSDTNSTGLQVPWIKGAGFNFTSNELYCASNYVRAVVARYLGVTHHWEIANEMDGKTTRNFGLPADEFAAFLVTNRNWIRAIDPQAQIVLPGCLGNYGYPFTNAYAWLRQILTNTGPAGFDVLNYHDYKSWWVLPADFDGYRAVLAEFNLTNLPVWITECSSPSASNNPAFTVPYASEDQQAADVWRRSCLLFGKGATTWFWHSLYSGPTGGFANDGLLTPGSGSPAGQKKKSWHAFSLLVQKIEGFQTATLLQLGNATTSNTNGGDGQWAVQFDWADHTRRYVAWSGTNLNYTLTNLTTNSYRLTTVVPTTISGDGETATFTIVTNTPVAGALIVTGLTNFPVLIESTVPAAPVVTNTALAQNVFTMTGTGPTAENYRVLAATNLTLAASNWTPVSAGTFSNGAFQFSDPTPTTNFPQRFYRFAVP